MLKIGETDAFERKYMARFRGIAADHGEFVLYERDRGARDIGLHLTRKLRSGGEAPSGALCWFQMKGVMEKSLSKEELGKAKEVKLQIEVRHLRFWALQPVPTYLAVYVESVDSFLILNISQYIEDRWGTKILTLEQDSVTVTIPAVSVLDDQAFDLLLRQSDAEQWAKALKSQVSATRTIRADYNLIWHLGTATNRGVDHRMVFWDWQSKTRSQFWFRERASDGSGGWLDLREHWQFMMNIHQLESAYPYVEFFMTEVTEQVEVAPYTLIMGEPPPLVLQNGDVLTGQNYFDEYFLYEAGVRLNDLGQDLFASVDFLAKVELLEIAVGEKEVISVAPWHARSV
jgi:hypothetical protein